MSRFGADYAPTAQQQEVYEVLNERLEGAKVLMDELLQVELLRLNEQLRARGIPLIS